MNTLNYRGYSSPIDYDDERAVFIAKMAEVPGARPIRAGNMTSLRRAFEREVDLHLQALEPDVVAEPWRGQTLVRIDSAVHAHCALAAQAAGMSLPLWIERTLRAAADRRLAAEGVRACR